MTNDQLLVLLNKMKENSALKDQIIETQKASIRSLNSVVNSLKLIAELEREQREEDQ